MKKKLELLKGVDLFSTLDDKQLASMGEMMRDKTYKKNEIIILEVDDPDPALFVIAEGQVKVSLTSEDGREAIIALLKEGDFFGEMALLDGEPRSATVKAVDDSHVFIIRREDFLQYMKHKPELAMTLLSEMSRRLRKTNRQISSLAMMRVCGRLAGTLLQIMEEKGIRSKTKEGRIITVIHDRPTHQTLAEMSGTSRETVSRMLKHLQDKGYVAINGKDLFILQEEHLRT